MGHRTRIGFVGWAAGLAVAAVLAGCGSDGGGTTDTTAATIAETVAPAPVTEAPVTEAPVTEPPVTEPPVTEPPATEPPPVTEAPATSAAAAAPSGPYAPTMTALCEAAALARAGDRTGSYDAFHGRAHEGLHELADELTAAGRRDVAGPFLVAKSKVESDLLRDDSPLADSMDALLTESSEALVAIGSAPFSCPAG